MLVRSLRLRVGHLWRAKWTALSSAVLPQGIFSGTLSYIFNTYKPGMKFSEVIADAKGKGFTEPDPRDDLSGTPHQPAYRGTSLIRNLPSARTTIGP